MTRRRNPPPRPSRPNRAKKEQEQLDNDLRVARANRRAESQQKQMLRRGDWDSDLEDLTEDPESLGNEAGTEEPLDEDATNDEDEDDAQ